MGFCQTSAVDGVGRKGLDIGFSARELVVSVDGPDQLGDCAMDRRSDLSPFRAGRQEADRPAPSHVDADLPVSRSTLQREFNSTGDLATCHVLLSPIVRNTPAWMGRRCRCSRGVGNAGQILFRVLDRQLRVRRNPSSRTTRLFWFGSSLDIDDHRPCGARTAFALAGNDRSKTL